MHNRDGPLKRRAVKTLGLVIAFVIHACTAFLRAADAPKEKIKVYVYAETMPQGFVRSNARSLEDSVSDLKKNLAKKRTIGVVSSPELADIRLEVLGRAHEATGTSTTTIEWGALKTREDTVAALRVRLIVGDYSEEFFAQTNPEHIFGAWGAVAGSIAGDKTKHFSRLPM